MKLLLLSLLMSISFLSYGQNIYQSSGAGYEGGIIRFKNDSVQEGYMKITSSGKIIFKNTFTSKEKTTYRHKELLGVKLAGRVSFEYKVLRTGRPLLMKVEHKGTVDIYSMLRMLTTTELRYWAFVANKGEDIVESLNPANPTLTKTYKRIVKQYFQHCPLIIEKSNNKVYKNKGVELLISDYIRECGNN